ncbi:MAG: cystathionine beta-synthase [Paludibacterium sp.]|uniref:cystathionine beta-synthase n=1 Tax=Paludibacterium sp. TaxID=1917523 RepID=UPI0025EC19B1|nr:cystathionine beta-synthase [Paludibacterium sp.]MBV8046022.1 cystathionine beta-synthase [Paludibacterium sp.]MBV8648232.1 cystathionine beta-synthase [Paludibacterium sp.]
MSNSSVLGLIGNTPLVQVNHLDTGLCQLFLKLESSNPGGSIKDRIGLAMIDAAERDGLLRPGGTLVEATAGNTGLGLALVAAQRGYRLILVVPDKMSREKVLHLQALGAEVRLTRSDVGKGHPAYYQDMARRIAEETPGAYYIDQFNNPANPRAHETGTAPEIWRQMRHEVDAVVVGVGSGGTLSGLSRFFARTSPHTEFVLADPQGSVLADYVETGTHGEAGSWLVEGVGEDFVPPQADLSRVKHAFRISDRESFETARLLLQKEGVLAGSSSGTLVAAALRYCRAQTTPKRVVTFVCDSGNKYLSKMYSDDWMQDQGMIVLPQVGTLLDLITHRHDLGQSITCLPDEALAQVYQRMRLFDVSQLPVLDGDRVVGVIDEWDLLLSVHGEPENFRLRVAEAMSTEVTTLAPDAGLQDLLQVFNDGYVALVVDRGHYVGLITQADLLAFWRRQPRER